MQWFKVSPLAIYSLTFLLISPGEIGATTTEIREKMAKLAQEILKITKQEPVAIGVFSPTGLPDSNSGPGLEAELKTALESLKAGSVLKTAKYEIKGDYAYAKTRNPEMGGIRVVKLNAVIIELEFNEPIVKLPIEVQLDHTASIGAITQVTASIPPEGSKQERQQEIDKKLVHPEAFIDPSHPSRVKSNSRSPYAVEVLVKPLSEAGQQPTPRSASLVDGQAFVEISKDEIYELVVYNESSEEVAVSVTVDGIDMFHFAQERDANGNPAYNHLIFPPKQTGSIRGWYQKLAPPDNYLSFLVTDYGKGAISKAGTPSRGQVGVVQFRFAKSRELNQGARAAPGLETGFGPPVSVNQQPVKREIEPPHEFLSIRYQRP